METKNSETLIREARSEDCEAILALMRELAIYERLEHIFVNTAEKLRESLFGTVPCAMANVAEVGGKMVGYSITFRSYSTFLGRPGIWIEDLFVLPDNRGKGIGKQLLAHIASKACAAGCERVEWAVLNWNQPAIDFYSAMGAEMMDSWKTCRLSGDSLSRFSSIK